MDDDSLFQDMVLFNPSSSSQLPLELPVINVNNNNNSVELPNHPENNHQQSQSTTPAAVTTTAGASIEPLDENLFSDLTLIQPQSESDDVLSCLDQTPVSPSSSSTSSRSTVDVANTTTTSTATTANATLLASPSQGSISRSLLSHNSSTRKKKKAGLRIGYGRANQLHDSVVDVDEPRPQTEHMVVSEEKVDPVEEKQENQNQEKSGISSELKVAEATTTEVEEQVLPVKDVPRDEEEVTQVEKKEISVEARYEQIKKQLAEKLDCAHKAVANVSVKRKELIRKRRKAVEELNFELGKYKEMEKELEEAVESEDFETAERISDSLAAAEKNKELLLIALREAEAECDAIDIKMQKALEQQILIEEQCATLLESFAVDADRDAVSVISNAETKTSEEMEKWLSLSEALEVKKMEVEIESVVLSGVCQVLDDSIDHVIKDDKEESQLLLKKKKILAEELQELLDLVKQKEAEISENDSKIENVEKRMADAVSGLHETQTNLHSKSENLQSGLSQLELENDDLARKKKEIDDFHLQEETRGSKIKELGQSSADEARMYQEVVHLRKSLIEFISKSREDKTWLGKTEQKLFDDVQILKQDISAVRASLQDLSTTKSGSQQAIESLKQRLLFIDKRLPEIESEKRVAAIARNFKEAARIANEAKALYVEKETLQLKIEEAMADLKKLEDDINNNVVGLKEREENISLMEKELEIVRYQWLILVSGAAMSERSAAIELGDDEEADILFKEAQAADFEAKMIQDTCKEEEFDSVLIPLSMLTSVNGDSPVTLKDNAPIVRITDSPSKLPAEPSQKKCAFQMSAPEDSFEMDDEVHANGHVSSALVDHNKLETTSAANEPAAAIIIETPELQEGSKSPALVKNNKPVFSEVSNSLALVESNKPVVPEVAKIPEPAELKEAGNNKSSPKTDVGFLGGSVTEQGIGFRMSTSPPLTTITQTSFLPESTFQKETFASGRDSSSSPFGQSLAAAPGFMFGSATPTPTQPAVSYQFGGQPNQAPPQNPFQSSSVEFNAGGGSFSLGSAVDKSGRRIVRVKIQNRRK